MPQKYVCQGDSCRAYDSFPTDCGDCSERHIIVQTGETPCAYFPDPKKKLALSAREAAQRESEQRVYLIDVMGR